MIRLLCIAALLGISGCDWIGRQADALGEYMPVIGERCEHWQCVTSSGQAKSDKIKEKKEQTIQPVSTPPPSAPDSMLQNVPPAVTEHQTIPAPPQ